MPESQGEHSHGDGLSGIKMVTISLFWSVEIALASLYINFRENENARLVH